MLTVIMLYAYFTITTQALAHWKETVAFGVPGKFLPKILSS